MGIGLVPQLAGSPSKFLTAVAIVGFVCNAIGQFLGHLFSADARVVSALGDKVAANTSAIITGDTTFLRRQSESGTGALRESDK